MTRFHVGHSSSVPLQSLLMADKRLVSLSKVTDSWLPKLTANYIQSAQPKALEDVDGLLVVL